MEIQDNIDKVRQIISASALNAGRDANAVTLAAVTKFQSAERINEAIHCGVKVIAENRAQELAEKYPYIDKKNGVQIHFIGHLQKNKIKYIIDKVDMVQSVDSLELASALDTAASKIGKRLDILLQVNIGNEPQKSGLEISRVIDAAVKMSEYSSLRLCGLMAILPVDVDKEGAGKLFSEMCKLFLDIRAKIEDNDSINVLSMGMSNDYAWAIENGSTFVRVGRAIFGERK